MGRTLAGVAYSAAIALAVLVVVVNTVGIDRLKLRA